MLVILSAFVAGYWLSQRAGVYRTEQGTDNLEIHTREIVADFVWLWLAFLSICAFAVTAGHNTRCFVDTVALPWLALVGLHMPAPPTLPALVLPTTQKAAISQPIQRQAA
jgi:hypothetical protein